jgi:hypothetical protein
MTMRNNQLEQALLRAGFVKAKEAKPTQLHDVTERKPEWQSLTHAEREHYQQQFNALS